VNEFHHGHEPRAEEIALHQKYLTLEGQIDAARLEGDEAEVRRASLRSPSEPRHAESRPIGDSFARTSHDEQEVSMERFSFGDDVAFAPRGNLLDGVTIAPLTQPFEEGALVQAAIFRFEPGARLRSIRRPCRRSSPSLRDQEK
jgi:hypothetical protein